MSELSYTHKFTLSITMKEFLKYAKPLIPIEKLKKEAENELMQCAYGIIDGDFGGNYHDGWLNIFFSELKKSGFIEWTQKAYDTFT